MAFQQHSKNSDRIRGRIDTASHFKSCQNVPNATSNEPECTSTASRLLPESIFDIKRIQLECTLNADGIFWLPLECGLNAIRMYRLTLNESRYNSMTGLSVRILVNLKFPPECGANFENSSFRLVLLDSCWYQNKCDRAFRDFQGKITLAPLV